MSHAVDPMVLLIDVTSPQREWLRAACHRRGWSCVAISGRDGPGHEVSDGGVYVVELTGRCESDAAGWLLAERPGARVVILGHGLEVEHAVGWMRRGASHVIALPRARDEIVAGVLDELVPGPGPADDPLIGSGLRMRRFRDALRRVAGVESSVLLQGETGTGKGLAARQIHLRSARSARPFVHVDCAALSPSLIESELFGHERGAFTGAGGVRQGRFELAGDGSLFLDEIGELSEAVQTKLLRVLEDRCYERVGGVRTLPMRARVIAATSRPLERAVQQGSFRADLYYRLDVLRLDLPALRERLEDLPELVDAGLARICARLAQPRPRVSESALARLAAHDWPGNVRELLNVLERVLVASPLPCLEVERVAAALPERGPHAGSRDLQRVDDEVERIRSALLGTGGNVARAARRLGMPRGTLRYRIERLQLARLIPRD